MQTSEERFTKKRLRSSYFTVIISISLVLFMLGLLGMAILQAKRLSTYVKENIGFSVILKDDVKDVDVVKFQKSLDAARYVKTTEFIDKDRAAKELTEDLGEDFVDFLGYNPLLSSIEVRLNADYANPDSLSWIEAEMTKNPRVKEVFYQRDLVVLVNENIKRISLVILVFSVLLLIIAIALINNSIRLSLYSKRFVIKTMQLVGATPAFIRMPFVLRGIANGLYGALIAIALLMGVLYYARQKIPELFEIQDVQMVATLFGMVLLLGIIITWISTSLAVRRFLRMKTDKLYS
ncbi:MAG: cell division protein FtsX [Crocinitomicaceae bacterium]|nr:cell division protein FtsX [Crocinitomicaceae bacterium]|tara:strand:+ start:27479 stop:28357 length:879 start_codon:yes stop_codon:yes gene_type:complete